MLEIAITPDHISRAKKKTAAVGILQGSITGGLSNVVGAIGEIIVADLTGALESNTHNYDLIENGKRVDVKTKRCNTKPLPNYDCSVAAHGTKQDCDEYVFVRIMCDMSRAWILGRVGKQQFFEKAIRYSRGDVDPANGFVFKADCYNLPIRNLEPVSDAQATQS